MARLGLAEELGLMEIWIWKLLLQLLSSATLVEGWLASAL
jgi:hypothetical protein